ncbi:Uncharacterised protein [Chromobacterium violaceum]|uniref:Uncharacterized protein n=1 Tax=Chromobacterium violaceum TaxID=536 RepID=A0A447T6J2_CHRVL|nr:Uncharacterised protein [Chromobacterium violaceum]
MFACTTKVGKKVELCDAGKTIRYAFGKPGAPEIALSVERKRASTGQWTGVGSPSYTVNVPNGDTVYTVFWGFDRNADDQPIEAGVHVYVKDKWLATVSCSGKKPIVQNIEDIQLPAEKI